MTNKPLKEEITKAFNDFHLLRTNYENEKITRIEQGYFDYCLQFIEMKMENTWKKSASQTKSQIVEQILGMMKESHIKYADTREGLRYLIQNDPEVSISLEWELGYNTAINQLRLQIKEEILKIK